MKETDFSTTGMGMLNMKTRISDINGEMNFESNSNGLITTIRIPLAA
jgi:signal transduction histidine kinase